MKRTGFRKGMLVLAGAALSLAAGLAGDFPPGCGTALAQAQAGRTAAGTTRGGNQGITPGGSGGVFNPPAGGGPTSVGEPLNSADPQASQNTRPGYLGGYVPPDIPPPPVVVTPSGSVAQGAPPQESVCEDMRGGFKSPSHRMTGTNSGRLDSAGALVHPDSEAREVQVLRLLLAIFQEELQKQSPDLTLAGTYLGVAADLPITEEMVAQIADSLCVPVRKDQAASIASVAEVQRQRSGKARAR